MRKKIGSFYGLRTIAVLALFWWHSSLPNPQADLGARACEFFFLCSGFLTCLQHYNSYPEPKWSDSVRVFVQKYKVMWPLHFLGFLFRITVIPLSVLLTKDTIINALINLSLFHAWSPYEETYMSFCGATWFLSCLLFCYFMSPVLIDTVKKKGKYFVFFGVFLFRLGLEILQLKRPGMFIHFSYHCSPVIRCLEFWMGVGLYPYYVLLKEKVSGSSKVSATVPELLIFSAVIALCAWNPTTVRAAYLVPFSLAVFVFAFDRGDLSDFFGLMPFRKLCSIALEILVFESGIGWAIDEPLKLIPNRYLRALVYFAVVLAASVIYHSVSQSLRKKKKQAASPARS
jgi:hypothetical protein